MKRFLFGTMLASALLGTAIAGPDHGDELDVEVGVNAAGQLAWPDFDFGKVLLEEFSNSPVPFLPDAGWTGDDPGWAGLGKVEDGISPLGIDAAITVEVIALSPALRMFDPAGGSEIVAGGTWTLPAGNEFDAHPIWVIDATSPMFDPMQQNWIGEFRLIDNGTTNYAASANHTFVFGTPEPGSLALLAVSLLLVRRR